MTTSTTYCKTVAVCNNGHGYDNGQRNGNNEPYLTWDISKAKEYGENDTPPDGFTLQKVCKTIHHQTFGGGYFSCECF